MLPTTIAGSLPKPAWLAEPERLWAPWQLSGEALEQGKRDASITLSPKRASILRSVRGAPHVRESNGKIVAVAFR